MDPLRIVIDTNVFVAAGFNHRSSSAQIISGVSLGRIAMVWHKRTRRETRQVLTQIPRLSWGAVAGLFRAENEYTGELDTGSYGYVQDRADRKYAALADACSIALVTNDRDLISVRGGDSPCIMTPVEFLESHLIEKGEWPS